MKKWNWKTKEYEDYEVPAEWNCKAYSDDMEEVVNCPHCGRRMTYGCGYTSKEIHTETGYGYAVCDKCYSEEWKRMIKMPDRKTDEKKREAEGIVEKQRKGKEKERKMVSNILNQKVIVRGDRSGVFFGTLTAKDGTEVKLENCRRLWYWDGAASISQIAKDGVSRPENCKFTVTVDEIIITDAIEIIPCTDDAVRNIEEVTEWKR